MKYKLFIDDSWSKDFINPYEKNLSDWIYPWNSSTKKWLDDNFFVLCWIYVSEVDLSIIDNEIKALKMEVFGTFHVEIKSVYLRNPKLKKRHYLDLFPLTTDASLKYFWDTLYSIIKKYKSKMTIMATIFDKRHYKNRNPVYYPDNQPLMKCSQALFERIEKIWNDTHIVFDQMESSLSVLKWKHRWICDIAKGNIWLDKSYINEYKHIKCVEFQQSHSENFLQIADICAYNVRRQFMQYWKIWLEGWIDICDRYEYFDEIRCNFYHSKGDTVWYWLVIIPNFNKFPWKIMEGCENI